MADDPSKPEWISHYILDENGEPVPEPDLMTWARWYGTHERHIGSDQIGRIRVSTVFLALNHAYFGGPPVLWETMIFGGPHDGYQERYKSRTDAEAGHARAVFMVRDFVVTEAVEG